MYRFDFRTVKDMYLVCKTVSTAPSRIAGNCRQTARPATGASLDLTASIFTHKTPAHMHQNNKSGHYSDSVTIDMTTDYLIY
jgi:hypothetical protein